MHRRIKRQQISQALLLVAVVLLLLCSLFLLPSLASPLKTEVHGKAVTSSILIDAPQETVFEAIRKERLNNPAMRKLISQDGTHLVVEQKFRRLPILDTAVCTYDEFEQPYSRIDMKMIKSDKFKRFEGYWELVPADSGKQTLTTLSLLCDTGLNLPFTEQITANRTKAAVWKRLYAIKTVAEKSNLNLNTGAILK